MSNKAEKKDQDLSSQDGEPSQIRLAVFEQKGGEKTPLARITFYKTEVGKWNVKLEAKTDENGKKLQPIIDRFVKKRAALQEGSAIMPPATALADDLIATGFIVEELPAADYTVGIQIELNTGRILGTNTALHDLASDDNPLGRRIIEPLSKNEWVAA